MILDIAVLLAPTGLTGLYLLVRGSRRTRRAAAISQEVAERTREEPAVLTSRRAEPALRQEPIDTFRNTASASLGGVRRGTPAAPPMRAEPPVRSEPPVSRNIPSATATPIHPAEQGEIFHIDFDDDNK